MFYVTHILRGAHSGTGGTLRVCAINNRLGVNFIHILRTHVLFKSALRSFFSYVSVKKVLLNKKCAHKMLMKLTLGLDVDSAKIFDP